MIKKLAFLMAAIYLVKMCIFPVFKYFILGIVTWKKKYYFSCKKLTSSKKNEFLGTYSLFQILSYQQLLSVF